MLGLALLCLHLDYISAVSAEVEKADAEVEPDIDEKEDVDVGEPIQAKEAEKIELDASVDELKKELEEVRKNVEKLLKS